MTLLAAVIDAANCCMGCGSTKLLQVTLFSDVITTPPIFSKTRQSLCKFVIDKLAFVEIKIPTMRSKWSVFLHS